MIKKTIGVFLAGLTLSGCAGKIDYTYPKSYSGVSNTKVVDASIDEVWKSAVPELGKRFFVINNIDKDSGLINISYSGDPEKYVDCGRIVSYVKNARGERTYNFPAAKKQQSFEILEQGYLFAVNRTMNLDGRVNLVFEEGGAGSTVVTANTKYIVTRGTSIRNVAGGFPQNSEDSVSFNSGSSASFPAVADGRATTCVPTGQLEKEILSAIK